MTKHTLYYCEVDMQIVPLPYYVHGIRYNNTATLKIYQKLTKLRENLELVE
mgnify:CR=1 FL=1